MVVFIAGLVGFGAGGILFTFVAWSDMSKEAADCAVGNMEREWWRKALVLAEHRKSEKERSK